MCFILSASAASRRARAGSCRPRRHLLESPVARSKPDRPLGSTSRLLPHPLAMSFILGIDPDSPLQGDWPHLKTVRTQVEDRKLSCVYNTTKANLLNKGRPDKRADSTVAHASKSRPTGKATRAPRWHCVRTKTPPAAAGARRGRPGSGGRRQRVSWFSEKKNRGHLGGARRLLASDRSPGDVAVCGTISCARRAPSLPRRASRDGDAHAADGRS